MLRNLLPKQFRFRQKFLEADDWTPFSSRFLVRDDSQLLIAAAPCLVAPAVGGFQLLFKLSRNPSLKLLPMKPSGGQILLLKDRLIRVRSYIAF